jgi:hypothetical protein
MDTFHLVVHLYVAWRVRWKQVGGRRRHFKADYSAFKDRLSAQVRFFHEKRRSSERGKADAEEEGHGTLDPHCEGGLATLQALFLHHDIRHVTLLVVHEQPQTTVAEILDGVDFDHVVIDVIVLTEPLPVRFVLFGCCCWGCLPRLNGGAARTGADAFPKRTWIGKLHDTYYFPLASGMPVADRVDERPCGGPVASARLRAAQAIFTRSLVAAPAHRMAHHHPLRRAMDSARQALLFRPTLAGSAPPPPPSAPAPACGLRPGRCGLPPRHPTYRPARSHRLSGSVHVRSLAGC